MKKRLYYLLCVLCLVLILLPGSAFAVDVTMILDGRQLVSDVAPEVKNGVTFVPVRVVTENLNANVDYLPADGENAAYVSVYNYLQKERVRQVNTGTAQVKLYENHMYFYAGDAHGYVGYNMVAGGDISAQEASALTKESYPLLAAPFIKNNRMMVPLRFIAERIGFTVDYADGKIVMISSEKLMLDGVELQDMLLEDNYVTKNKTLISSTVELLESARGKQCAAVSDYAYVTPKLAFRNAAGETVAIWQFAAPQGESWDNQPFSALYLHDRLNDIWYIADQTVYDELYNANLENYFLPPYYAFEKIQVVSSQPPSVDGVQLKYATTYSRVGMHRELNLYSNYADTARLYAALQDGIIREVSEPETSYGNLFEISDYYIEQYIVGFYDEAPIYEKYSGENAVNADLTFVLYEMLEGEPEFGSDSRQLLYDQQTGKWYAFSADAYKMVVELLQTAQSKSLYSVSA